MRKRSFLSIVAAALMLGLLPATAATESYDVAVGVGYSCSANAVVPNQTLLVAGEPSPSRFRTTVGGIITGWGVEVGPGVGPVAQQLVVFEPLGNGAYRKVAESKLQRLVVGINSFDARIPVKGGESVGLFGPEGTLACNPESERIESTDPVSLRSEGGVALGETMTFETVSGVGTPLSAAVDGDYDGDGYGDEGQDRCYGTASRGSDCPIETKIVRAELKRRAIVLQVAPEAQARIEVGGEVLWRRKEDGLLTGAYLNRPAPQQVEAGRRGTFRVGLPEQVLRRLDRIRPGKSMAARLYVYIVDRDGWESQKTLRVQLPGRR